MEQAKEGKRAVFFVDAAHFVLAPFLGFLWSFVRVFVRAPAGRQRFNVLGAIEAVSLTLVTVTNATTINAQSVCELLRKLRTAVPEMPLTLVLDNARYQRNRLVFALAAELQIELLFLPPYSPNLNLIERLWKLVKKTVCSAGTTKRFPLFKRPSFAALTRPNKAIETSFAPCSPSSFRRFQIRNLLQAKV